MAKRQKKDNYIEVMRIWLMQKAEEIRSCERMIERFRREIAFHGKEIVHARRGIRLEQEQIDLSRRTCAEAIEDIREYDKRTGVLATLTSDSKSKIKTRKSKIKK